MQRIPLLRPDARRTAAIAAAQSTTPAIAAAATGPSTHPKAANSVQLP